MKFNQMELAPAILKAIDEQGYTTPTPIQQQAIPVILQGRDILAGAQTGTGKTAGFALPLLQILQQQPRPKRPQPIRVLVLVPTRELAAQVYESFKTYGKHLPLTAELVFGGVNIHSQIKRLKKGADILVATPGRLLDLLYQKQIDLSQVQHFVLDEADRMLDMGFIRDIRKIIEVLPKNKQNLMFSATYDAPIKKLAEQLLNNPVEVAVARQNETAANIKQLIYPVAKEDKRDLLAWLIGHGQWHQVLVFVRTKHGADKLVRQLVKNGIRSVALHGNKSQSARNRALQSFKDGEVTALIATDIAARGLDIEQLPHVVNYDLPAVAEDYVHRIGRTGRAGNEGEAISLVSSEEAHLLHVIERLLKSKLPRVADTGYAPVSLDDVRKPAKKKASPGKKPARKPSKNPRGTIKKPAGAQRRRQKPAKKPTLKMSR
jgi:ATP-dependent RNA helicase RhlE